MESWLYGVARISIIQLLAKGRRQDRRSARFGPSGSTPGGTRPGPPTLADTAADRLLWEGLRAAGSTVAAIFDAHDVDGRSFAEIGEGLEMTEGAVKSRYYRSLPELRRRLRRLWGDR